MIVHKLIKVGNAYAITIPKKFIKAANIELGDKFAVETNFINKTVFVKPVNITYQLFMTPDFFYFLKVFNKNARSILHRVNWRSKL